MNFLFAILLFYSSIGVCDSKPEWVYKTPKETLSDKFYVGRAANLLTEAKAFEEASRNAVENAIRDNYGFSTSIQNQTYDSNHDWDYNRRIQEYSKTIELNSFEFVDNFIEQNKDDTFNVYILYKYSKTAIAEEKRRLKTVSSNSETKFSIIGGIVDQQKGGVELITDPPGAEVRIDGERWGVTPIRILGQLKTGSHRLELDHQKYKVVNTTFLTTPGSLEKINEKLYPAEAEISVNTLPVSSKIFLNGKFIGLSPLANYKVRAGEDLQLEYVHPDFEKQLNSVNVPRDSKRELTIELLPKPAFIKFEYLPADTAININGQLMQTEGAKKWINIGAGKKQIILINADEEIFSETIVLSAGDRKIITKNSIKAPQKKTPVARYEASVSEVTESVSLWPGKRIKDYWGFSFEFSGGSLERYNENGYNSVSIFYGGKLLWPIGFEIGFGYDFTNSESGSSSDTENNYSQKTDTTIDLTGESLYLAIPVYLRVSESTWFFLDGEYGSHRHRFYKNSTKLIDEASQTRMGFGAGFTGAFADESSMWSLKLVKNKFSDALDRSGLESTTIRFSIMTGTIIGD